MIMIYQILMKVSLRVIGESSCMYHATEPTDIYI